MGDIALVGRNQFGWQQNLIWDAATKRWQTIWRGREITLKLNDDGSEHLDTVSPIFTAALKLEPNAREYLSAWINIETPGLTGVEISNKLQLFHLGCEADGMIWFLYNTGDLVGDLLAHSDVSVMVTLHDDGRFENIRFLERN